MRVRTPHIDGVQHARLADVGGVASAASHLEVTLDPIFGLGQGLLDGDVQRHASAAARMLSTIW